MVQDIILKISLKKSLVLKRFQHFSFAKKKKSEKKLTRKKKTRAASSDDKTRTSGSNAKKIMNYRKSSESFDPFRFTPQIAS
jgi:hypothetical protein